MDLEEVSMGLRSDDAARRRAALRQVSAVSPDELAAVDAAALLGAIGEESVPAIKRALAYSMEGLEMPLDPDDEGMRAEVEPGLDESPEESMDAARRQAEAEDG